MYRHSLVIKIPLIPNWQDWSFNTTNSYMQNYLLSPLSHSTCCTYLLMNFTLKMCNTVSTEKSMHTQSKFLFWFLYTLYRTYNSIFTVCLMVKIEPANFSLLAYTLTAILDFNVDCLKKFLCNEMKIIHDYRQITIIVLLSLTLQLSQWAKMSSFYLCFSPFSYFICYLFQL